MPTTTTLTPSLLSPYASPLILSSAPIARLIAPRRTRADLSQKAKVKAPLKKAAATKTTTTKPAAKKPTQSKLTMNLANSKKRPKAESDDEDGDAGDDGNSIGKLSSTPPSAKKQRKAPVKKAGGKPLAEIQNDSLMEDVDVLPASKSKKTATETYQKLTQLEHIIKRPDTYIGSVERSDQQMWVFNKETKEMEKRSVSFVPGLYKIFDEILVNAADNKQRDSSMTHLKITVDRESGEITVENNGKGIAVEIHGVRFTSSP